MQIRLANILSYLFHPLLFPTYGTIFIIFSNPHLFGQYTLHSQSLWVFIVFALTFLFPVICLVLMKNLELVQTLTLEENKQRIIPYIFTATFYLWTYELFKPSVHNLLFPNTLISWMMLGATLSIFIGFFINIFTKISLHTIGMGNFVGLILSLMRISDYDLRGFFIVAILLAGAIGTARLLLKAHENKEVNLGYLIGFTGQFLAFSIVPLFLQHG